jgi:tRNA A37 threonylcarbamoyladenosine dehydratase
MTTDDIFARVELLVGEECFRALQSKKVILFGVGGVGSWCAEGLVRSGISHLTLVDSDRVAPANINRQLPATTRTIGD